MLSFSYTLHNELLATPIHFISCFFQKHKSGNTVHVEKQSLRRALQSYA
jgi:hypothetical protein